MKKILVIGSTVVDVIINVDHLPTSKASVNIYEQDASIGGCAFNAFNAVRYFDVPAVLFSPVGKGIYGEFISNELNKRGICSAIEQVEDNNGCCYCFVEENGERTFISHHGTEYLFNKEWFDAINADEISAVYACGLEIEEKTGLNIIEWLEKHPELPVYFATGPRIQFVQSERMERLFKRHVILHLNDDEAKLYTGKDNLDEAMKCLYEKTSNTVIVTRGKDGASFIDEKGIHSVSTTAIEDVVDTIGAGDNHIGTIMACLYKKMDMADAVDIANKVSSRVVGVKGALLPEEIINEIKMGL